MQAKVAIAEISREISDSVQLRKMMIKAVADAFHAKNKKVTVILNVGGVVETASWKDMPDAILLAWQGGQETGNSIADILNRECQPVGQTCHNFPGQLRRRSLVQELPRERTAVRAASSGPAAGFFARQTGGSDI